MARPEATDSYTYEDYLSWDGEDRYELINGEAFLMASPSSEHQRILGEIARQIGNFLDGKHCDIYPAPFDVRLFEGMEEPPAHVRTVVQPDISVVCDKEKIDDRGCHGAPDFVIEILSPSTLRMDRLLKFRLYQQAGVREYWIVDPRNRSVQVFLPTDEGILHQVEEYLSQDIARVHVLDGCFVDLGKVYR
ncbi:MAG: Uma2 family endonuclease [Selenomonadaceae bacterium]|nr:Uma2 family endonuclease [Selenomonadaceae bacterium]